MVISILKGRILLADSARKSFSWSRGLLSEVKAINTDILDAEGDGMSGLVWLMVDDACYFNQEVQLDKMTLYIQGYLLRVRPSFACIFIKQYI